MRCVLTACKTVSLFVSQFSFAQQSTGALDVNDFNPAPTNISGVEYPRVNNARQFHFPIYAPDAQSLQVSHGKKALTKSDEGFWTGDTPPLNPGFHDYTINFDDMESADTASQISKAGIKNIYYESPGTTQEWLTWRRYL